MRKSTATAVVLLGGVLVVMMWAADAGMSQHRVEIELGSRMSREFEADLAPGSRVRLKRERGSEAAIVSDKDEFVLLLTATPAGPRWDRDATGKALGRDLAERAHADPRYGPERPVRFVEVVLTKPDGARVRLGFREDVGGRLVAFPVPPLPS